MKIRELVGIACDYKDDNPNMCWYKILHEFSIQVEFVSYDGEFPNLCMGSLVISINGEKIEFEKYMLFSGGHLEFPSYQAYSAPYSELEEYIFEESGLDLRFIPVVLALVNEHVPYGCCGGCS